MPLKAWHQNVDIVPTMALSRKQSATVIRESSISLISDDHEDSSESDMDEEIERSMLPGLLGHGVKYTVREVIAQGHLHKKGSGLDFLGSRYWKARWAVLVVSL